MPYTQSNGAFLMTENSFYSALNQLNFYFKYFDLQKFALLVKVLGVGVKVSVVSKNLRRQ